MSKDIKELPDLEIENLTNDKNVPIECEIVEEAVPQNNKTIYTKKEENILDKVLDLRVNVLDTLAKQDLANTSVARTINEVATGLENSVMKRGDQRLKQDENSNNDKYNDMVNELLNQNAQDRMVLLPGSRDVEINDNEIPNDVVKDETHVGKQNLKLNEFIETDEGDE